MTEQHLITSYVTIRRGSISVNGKADFALQADTPADFLRAAYKHYELNYPKFYKMDSLCKLAFIASELLLRANRVTGKYAAEDIAIVIANSASSLEVDTEHQRTISDPGNYFPSPAIFVYTLPNILIGEIAIRNQVKGENGFFIFDTFDPQFMNSYIDSVLSSGRAGCCIAGWADLYGADYDAFLYTVERSGDASATVHTAEQLNNLYK